MAEQQMQKQKPASGEKSINSPPEVIREIVMRMKVGNPEFPHVNPNKNGIVSDGGDDPGW